MKLGCHQCYNVIIQDGNQISEGCNLLLILIMYKSQQVAETPQNVLLISKASVTTRDVQLCTSFAACEQLHVKPVALHYDLVLQRRVPFSLYVRQHVLICTGPDV